MGCDGGTIPRRDELVRTKKKKETKDKEAEIAAKWKYCAISSKELSKPIVSCELGRLYNKDAVIEYLLNKEAPNSSLLGHIRNLKDVVTLNLKAKDSKSKQNLDSPSTSSESSSSSNSDYKYVCPIVDLEMNGKYKFYYIRTCGCVVSERALKEVQSKVCLVCNKPFDLEEDLIVINGDEDEVRALKDRMIKKRNRIKEEKKQRKRKIEPEASSKNEQSTSKLIKNDPESQNGKSHHQDQQSSSNVKTSSLAVLSKKATKEYSISKDPNASETYKSLFTTHQSAKNRPKAHWVTFNPCYN